MSRMIYFLSPSMIPCRTTTVLEVASFCLFAQPNPPYHHLLPSLDTLHEYHPDGRDLAVNTLSEIRVPGCIDKLDI